MLYILREAYGIFRSMNPDCQIGFSKFCTLRPFYVRKLAETPHNVCVCVYHGNMALLVTAVQKVSHEFPTNVATAFVCDDNASTCMFGECADCGLRNFDAVVKTMLSSMSEQDRALEIPYHQWQQTLKVPCDPTPAAEIFSAIRRQLPYYLRHTLIKRRQSSFFQKMLQLSAAVETIVIQVSELL